MKKTTNIIVILAIVLTTMPGCHGRQRPTPGVQMQRAPTQIAETQLAETTTTSIEYSDAEATPAPRSMEDFETAEAWNLSLQEAIQLTLANSKVMRDLGGQLINNPSGARSVYEPALRESDPRFGTEAALSAFDAQFTTNTFWNKQDRAVNNIFEGGGTTLLRGDTGTFQNQISKRGVTGSQFTVRNNINYQANNVSTNTFPSAWDTNIETEFRHPLLQGGGVQFNQIAGPSATPGLYFSNGVLVSRINTDISLADFEASVRNLVSDVENSYWDLYYAYRDLNAKVAARNSALETWRAIHAKYLSNSPGGEAAREAEASEQYFIMQAAVEDAQVGGPARGTLSGGGSGGGVFRGGGGVYAAERRLRVLLGNLAHDDRLIRPCDEPPDAKVVFDWNVVLHEALARRVELRRQKWLVKRRELELIAARNFLLPRLDAVGIYRWRGFGNDLISAGRAGKPEFDNAFMNLTSGEFQEWQLGAQFQVPIGYRQGHAAVRNAQLQLTRERAVLHDQEMQVAHDLSAAVADVDRIYTLLRTNFNRRAAAWRQVESAQAAYAADAGSIDAFLTAQRRFAEADGSYYRTLTEYAVAVKNVHFEKGTLLDYDGVYLTEGPWAPKAYADASQHALDRRIALPLSELRNRPTNVGARPFSQQILETQTEDVETESVPKSGAAPQPLKSPPEESLPMESVDLSELSVPLPTPSTPVPQR